ncbi:MAG: MFS transporter [Chloroflexi bacterium]|nr:MFS transporter [Chloroflexota bacterium]
MGVATESSDSTISMFHWRMEFLLGLYFVFTGATMSTLSSALAQIVRDWSLTPGHAGTVITANAVGSFVGAAIVGNIADRWGRKTALQLVILALALGAGLSAIAWDFPALVAFQFISGLGVGAAPPALATLLTEFAPARYRGRLLGLTNVFYISGWLLATMAAYFLIPQFGWRALFLFALFPIIYLPISRIAIPESPRYLASHGQTDAANEIVRTIHQRYGTRLVIGSIGSKSAESTTKRILELWSPQLIRRTVCTWALWFALVYSFSGIFVWMPTLLSAAGYGVVRSFEFVLVITMAQLPGVIVASFLMDRIGRKRVVVPALLLCGIAAYLFGQATSPQELLVWGSLISVGNLGGWAVMLAYTPELYPTRARGTGAGMASAFGRVGGIAVPGIVGLMLGSWGGSYSLLFWMFAGVLTLGGLTVALFGEETVGRTLEDITSQARQPQ